MKAGAAEVIERRCGGEALISAVRSCLANLAASRQQELARTLRQKRFASLTAREREICGHILDGRSNKAIGEMLGISPRTVEIHRGHIMTKLGVESFAAFVRLMLVA
jgi:two-component system response regulator FixJ